MNHHLQLNILAAIARSAPDFKFDQLHGAGHTTFSHYYEFLPFDGIRVWASVHIGSKVEKNHCERNIYGRYFHTIAAFSTKYIQTTGPIGFFFLYHYRCHSFVGIYR